MLLSHDQIFHLIEQGVVENADTGALNASSLDIHLGDTVLVENHHGYKEWPAVLDYRAREAPPWRKVQITEEGFLLHPGAFILAHTREVFNLPLDVSAEYKLKSSMARIGLEHMNAGWCDAGWHGSALTLEFKNMSQVHSILLRPGDAVGQLVFFRHEPVDLDNSYAVKGRYNKDGKTVKTIKE